jgi:hypothetical protein
MATINVQFETEKKEYPPQVVIGQYKCELLNEDKTQVITSSETLDVVVDLPADPGVFHVRLYRVDGSGVPLPDSTIESGPHTVNQLADVPKTMTILLSLI